MSPGALRLRCRRGMLELDLLLVAFLEKGWDALDDGSRQAFVSLLDLPDERLWAYLSGLVPPPEDLGHVVARIRAAAP